MIYLYLQWLIQLAIFVISPFGCILSCKALVLYLFSIVLVDLAESSMRNYQTLTIIGGIINILIILIIGLLVVGLSSLHESFGNFTTQYGTQQQINKFYQDRASINTGLQYFIVAIPVSVVSSIIGI